MTKSVWIYVNPSRACVKVFDTSDAALEWFRQNDPEGLAVQWPVEEAQQLTEKPKRADYQILIDAFLQTRTILSDYVEDGKACEAVDRLMNAIINDRVIAAISRIEERKRFGLIEGVRSRVDDAS